MQVPVLPVQVAVPSQQQSKGFADGTLQALAVDEKHWTPPGIPTFLPLHELLAAQAKRGAGPQSKPLTNPPPRMALASSDVSSLAPLPPLAVTAAIHAMTRVVSTSMEMSLSMFDFRGQEEFELTTNEPT